jgi:hypothetical protein
MEVTILFRDHCHLCHVALRIAREVQIDSPFILRSVDIARDPRLFALYGHRIPVVLIDQDERLAGKITERELRAALKKNALEQIDKPDSVPTRISSEPRMIISLERELPRASCSLPEDHRSGQPLRSGTGAHSSCPPIWPCSG